MRWAALLAVTACGGSPFASADVSDSGTTLEAAAVEAAPLDSTPDAGVSMPSRDAANESDDAISTPADAADASDAETCDAATFPESDCYSPQVVAAYNHALCGPWHVTCSGLAAPGVGPSGNTTDCYCRTGTCSDGFCW